MLPYFFYHELALKCLHRDLINNPPLAWGPKFEKGAKVDVSLGPLLSAISHK